MKLDNLKRNQGTAMEYIDNLEEKWSDQAQSENLACYFSNFQRSSHHHKWLNILRGICRAYFILCQARVVNGLVHSADKIILRRKGEAKRFKIAGEDRISGISLYLASFFSLESGCSFVNRYRIIFSMKLMKAWESIFDQVD